MKEEQVLLGTEAINPRTYKQIHTPTVVQGGVNGTLPGSFDMLQYFKTILPLVKSL